MHLIYPGIKKWTRNELDEFAKIGKAEFKKMGLNDCFVIGYVGRLASENQVDLVIKAFSKLQKRGVWNQNGGKTIKLLILGDGSERKQYEDLAKNLGVSQKVYFSGFISEVTKFSLLSQCNVFTFTRAWELDGFGITSIEAMSLGVPLITTNFGPQKEVIEDGVSGLYFEPNNADDLAEKISKVLTYNKLSNKLAKNGLIRVQEFNNEISLEKMSNIIKDI